MVRDAYEFLINNYEADDYVYVVGFGRGAAAARSLTGLAELFGALPKGLMDRFQIAWDYYNTQPKARGLSHLREECVELGRIAEQGERLRADHERECERGEGAPVGMLERFPHAPRFASREGFYARETPGPLRRNTANDEYIAMPLHFVGVWETVFASDWQGFREGRLAWNVGSAYQALAMHEVRDDFRPELWDRKCRHQVINQTWFAGCHADVGGANGPSQLSCITLAWMIERVRTHLNMRPGHTLEFDSEHLGQGAKETVGTLTFPQHEAPWRWRSASARRMGCKWKGEDLQFRSRTAVPDPSLYAGLRSEALLQEADGNGQGLPLER